MTRGRCLEDRPHSPALVVRPGMSAPRLAGPPVVPSTVVSVTPVRSPPGKSGRDKGTSLTPRVRPSDAGRGRAVVPVYGVLPEYILLPPGGPGKEPPTTFRGYREELL